MSKKIVLALGGNALGSDPKEQLNSIKNTASTIVDLVEKDYKVIIGHGNGPQVGMISSSMDCMPFPECNAMSQGYIGYQLQQSIQNELKKRHIKKNVVTLVTQVIVDKNDPAFSSPSKPIGKFYTEEELSNISNKNEFVFKEDSGRGYRRVVPSPIPRKIVELNTIKKLIKQNSIVITVGGGGIPVIKENKQLKGIDAVIDKDKSCAKLASDLKADKLLILTAVEKVFLHYNKTNQKPVNYLKLNEAIKYNNLGEFAEGSMKPKIEACIDFIKKSPKKSCIITSLSKALDALNKKTGTKISK